MKTRAAFGFAELIITLLIVSMLAAFTIPTLIKNYRASTYKAGLKYAYSFISQTIQRMTFEEGMMPTVSNYPRHEFKPAFVKYVKVMKDCGWGWSDVDQDTKPCVQRNKSGSGGGSDFSNYKTYNRYRNASGEFLDDGQFILLNGMYVFIENTWTTVGGPIYITVDVNGYVKKPNLWGHDLFTFQIMEDGKVLPMGAEGTTFTDTRVYCSRSSSNDDNGIGCTYKALSDEEYWKNLP